MMNMPPPGPMGGGGPFGPMGGGPQIPQTLQPPELQKVPGKNKKSKSPLAGMKPATKAKRGSPAKKAVGKKK